MIKQISGPTFYFIFPPNTAQHICMTYMQIEMIRIVVGVDVVIAVVVFDIPGKNRHNIFFIFLHYKKLKII